jgi:hypothetical protein
MTMPALHLHSPLVKQSLPDECVEQQASQHPRNAEKPLL